MHNDVKIKKSNSLESQILKVYSIYQKKTQDLNAMDFGDLILFTVKLFDWPELSVPIAPEFSNFKKQPFVP